MIEYMWRDVPIGALFGNDENRLIFIADMMRSGHSLEDAFAEWDEKKKTMPVEAHDD